MRRTGSWKWLVQPAVFAALLVLAAAGGGIGWRVGGVGAAAIGAGVGLAVAVLLVLTVDRFGAALVSPQDRRRARRRRRG